MERQRQRQQNVPSPGLRPTSPRGEVTSRSPLLGERAGEARGEGPSAVAVDLSKTPRASFARTLRQTSTDAEQRLWYLLRNRGLGGFKFRRQFPIGPYIVDFCCYDHRLIVELDGGQHAEREEYDHARTSYLKDQGYRVLRFWNNVVLKETDAVCQVILGELTQKEFPLPKGEGQAPAD